MAKKYIDAELLRKKVEKLDMESCISEEWSGFYYAIDSVLDLIDSLQQEQPDCIEKTARISPGLLSNFGTSTFVLDVDLTQEEMTKVSPFGFNSGKIKIKIVCE